MSDTMQEAQAEPLSEYQISKMIEEMPDEVMSRLQFTLPFNGTGSARDEDGFAVRIGGDKDYNGWDFAALQNECWVKFNSNPQINSSIRDYMGRVTGQGFEQTCPILEIDEVMHETIYDRRNRLFCNMSKWVARRGVEGELFLVLTVHDSGFIEVDFRDPATLTGVGQDNCGILFHPTKPQMPLVYQFVTNTYTNRTVKEQIPSINVAYFPEELVPLMKKLRGYQDGLTKAHKKMGGNFDKIGGFFRFVVQWDTAFLTKRNLSWLRSIIEWCNYYEMLKKYEIDHKRSSGSYLWVIEIESPHAFRSWLGLSEAEREKTGIMAKPTPGGKIVLPPGMKMTVQNPNLPKISESDTDIMHMITAGLNMPEDMITGQAKGTKSSIGASRPPQADRISDEIAYFDRFLKFDFWSSIFFLRNAMDPSFKLKYPTSVVTGFTGEGESMKPVVKTRLLSAEHLIEIAYPVSEISDMSGRVSALCGVKHGSLNATLGIPNEAVAKKLGFGNYHTLRLRAAAEESMYPKLQPEVDQAAATQEKAQEKIKGSGEGKKPAEGKAPAAKPEAGKPIVRQRTTPVSGK